MLGEAARGGPLKALLRRFSDDHGVKADLTAVAAAVADGRRLPLPRIGVPPLYDLRPSPVTSALKAAAACLRATPAPPATDALRAFAAAASVVGCNHLASSCNTLSAAVDALTALRVLPRAVLEESLGARSGKRGLCTS